jgi:UDP-3-O-[3-hydroxymyristoyl] N-acetylglucosamine deacetylase
MELSAPRRTLGSTCRFEGPSLHKGEPTACTVHPGENGIEFRCGGERIVAVAENVGTTVLQTTLGPVKTVEHIMSALAGLGISDAVVELEADELPALDGSALDYVDSFLAAGFEDLPDRQVPRLFQRVYHIEDDLKISVGAGEGHFKFVFATSEGRWPGVQEAEVWLGREGDYAANIAPARTLAFEEDVPRAIAAGIGQGLGKESCLILGPEGYRNDARFDNEPARHKLLDLVGDLALTGYPLHLLNVVAERSGHRSHVAAALKVRQALGWLPAD